MVYGINNKKSRFRPAFLQALTLVEIDVVHSAKKDIQSIKDIRVSQNFVNIPFDPIRNSVALFISEVIFRSLQHSEPDEQLYHFLEESIIELDNCSKGLANFHLIFMFKLTRYLGFEPYGEELSLNYFDLMNGVYLQSKPSHQHFLNEEDTQIFLRISEYNYQNMERLKISREKRYKILGSMIEFYKLHIPEFHGLNSLAILQEIFN
jgi:DNA repair protein RecO (recombination protein O)